MAITDRDRWIACLSCEIHGQHTGMWTGEEYTDSAADLCLMPGQHLAATIEIDSDDMRRCLLGSTATDGEVYLARRAFDDIGLAMSGDAPAFLEYLRYRTDLPFSPDGVGDFESSYKGQFADRGAYARHYAEMVGEWSEESASWPTQHIDWHRAAGELFYGTHRWTIDAPDGQIYVFGDEK